MSQLFRSFVLGFVGVCLAGVVGGCASGRVRGAQGTEMGMAQEYEPEKKADPPISNVDRTSGPLTLPNPPPVLEVDLERRRKPPPGELEPEPEPQPKTTK
ncbi:MAG: hypothetical protein WBM48_06830 [Polyangiales bacterium]|jgi:hypothetical protein